MATYTIDYTADSVTFTVVGLSSTTKTHVRFYIRYGDVSGSEIFSTPPIYAISGNTMVKTFSLEPETYYACTVYLINYVDGVMSDAETIQNPETGSHGTFFTTPEKTEVEAWSWTTVNGPMYLATAAQTQAAYAAITGGGNVSNFSYLVWNDLIYKAKEVIEDRSGSWNTTYGTFSDTLMTASDKAMTATRFNSLWWNLAQYVSTGLSTKRVTGDELKGNYLVLMANAVNNAIW